MNYHMFTCCTENYLDVTYVMLYSFYQWHKLPVTVYMVNCDIDKAVDKFKDFPLVTCKRIDNITNKKHSWFNIDVITAKLKIVDNVNSEYFLSIDSDILFLENIENILLEYTTAITGVTETAIKRSDVINAGFLIIKKPNISLCNVLEKRWRERLRMPEQEILSEEFSNDMTVLDSRYNTTWSTNRFNCDNPAILHYAVASKPWSDFETTWKYISGYSKNIHQMLLRYVDYAISLNISDDFKMRLLENKKLYKELLK